MNSEASIPVLLCMVAIIYGSVGHAGASGYLALLTLAGWSANDARSFALILNLFASVIVAYRFIVAGYFRPRLFIPLSLASFPGAILGAGLIRSTQIVTVFIATVLIFSAIWLLTGKRETDVVVLSAWPKKVLLGWSLGFLAGVSGTGGGIFLSPALLFLRWAKLKEVAATSAPFIFVNSLGGVIGIILSGQSIRPGWMLSAILVGLGGAIGASVGVRIGNTRIIQTILSAVIIIAGLKLLLV